VVEKEEDKRRVVDWKRFETCLRLEGDKEEWKGREWKIRRRLELEVVVEKFGGRLMEIVEENRGRRKWRGGKKRWWDEELEEEYRRCEGVERAWRREGEGVGMEEVREMRKEFKRRVEMKKRDHWVGYLESLGERESYQWVKTDRDFVVDVPGIKGENRVVVEDDEGKG